MQQRSSREVGKPSGRPAWFGRAAWVALGLLLFLGLSIRAYKTWSKEDESRVEPQRSAAAAVAPRSASTKRSSLSIRGSVLDAGGAPTRASVLVARLDAGPDSGQRWHTETGAHGRFALEEVPSGQYEVWAWSSDGSGARASCEVVNDSATVELRLSGTGELTTGTVRDTAGGVVAAAQIRLSHANAGLDRAIGAALSDSAGRYRLRLPPGTYWAQVSAAGYALAKGVVEVGVRGGEQDFHLSPAAAIAGRLLRADGTPARSATLTLRLAHVETSQPQWPRTLQVDDAGAFSEGGISPGTYRLVAELEDESGTLGPFDLEAGQEKSELALTLSTGRILRGSVVSTQGIPVADAAVDVRQDDAGVPSRSGLVRSDAAGNFEARGLFPEHTTVLVVDHPEFEQRIETLGRLSTTAEPRSVDLVLRPAMRLSGRVVSESGMPIPGAQVSVEALQGPKAPYAWASSDENGEFVLRAALDGTPPQLAVRARHPRHGLGRAEVSPAGNPLTIALASGLYVAGEVRDERGAAVPFARVLATQVEPRISGSQGVEVSDALGAFRIGPFEPGTVSVELRGAAASLPSEPSRALVELRVGRDATGVKLIAPLRQSRISGRVIDENGQAIAGATVLVAPERFGVAARSEGLPALTDATGSFSCEGLAAGPYKVFVEAFGYPSASRSVVAPGTLDLRLGLEPLPSQLHSTQ